MVSRSALSDRTLKSLEPAPAGRRTLHYDSLVPNLAVRVTDKGSRSFVLVARFPGSSNPTPRTIGEYPAVGLAEARTRARAWLEDIRVGVDPKVRAAAQAQEAARQRANTFAAVFEEFARDHLSTLRTGAVVAKTVENHVYPAWRDRPLTELKRADVNALMRDLKAQVPIGVNRVLAYLKRFFAWTVDQDLLEANPAASVKRPSKETARDRVLLPNEIAAIWHACEAEGAMGAAIRVMLITGQRRGEVAGMRWDELDEGGMLWRLARTRTKADRAHEIPLSGLAREITESLPRLDLFVFSTGRSGTAPSGWGKAKARVDQVAAELLGGQLAEWHLHDLRRTCATNLARLGADRIVISKILNHAEAGVTRIYDRHAYESEKREALDAWGEALRVIVSGSTSGAEATPALRK